MTTNNIRAAGNRQPDFIDQIHEECPCDPLCENAIYITGIAVLFIAAASITFALVDTVIGFIVTGALTPLLIAAVVAAVCCPEVFRGMGALFIPIIGYFIASLSETPNRGQTIYVVGGLNPQGQQGRRAVVGGGNGSGRMSGAPT